MKKLFSLFAALLFAGSMMATGYELVYTLDGSVTSGGNSNYAQDGGGLTQSSIEWSVTGNTTINPWRIGGKNLDDVDRMAYSKTAISDDIAKIEIEHGTKTLSAINSMKVEVASDAAFANIVSTFTPTYEPSATVTVLRPDGASWANCYYRITYNVDAGGSNSYLQLISVKFYKESNGEAPAVAAPAISGEASFFDQTEVTITCATEGAAIHYTLDGSDPTAESSLYEAAFNITETTTVKAIAISGEDASTIASKTFTKGLSFASFEALVAADVATNTRVKVSFSKVKITGIYTSSKSKRQGVYLDVKAANDKNVEIYYNVVEVPAEWEDEAVLSGSIIGSWTYYENGDQWEIVPEGTWNWTSLTYEVLPQLNIMAYGLSASEVADGKVTISYSLNAKATAVEIQLLDAEGAVAETFAAPATGLAKGAHSVEIDLADVDAGSYHWAVKATAKTSNATEPVKVTTVGTGSAMSRVVTLDNSYESPYYGNIYAIHGLGVGLYGFNASLEPLFGGNAVATNGWNPSSNSSPCAAKVSEDGLVYINDWADTNPNVRIFDPATPNADAKNVFGGTGIGSGLMVNEAGDTIHGSMRYCYPKGSGENTILYTVDEDYKPGNVTHVFTYNIGTAATPWTAKPSGEGFTHAMTGGKWAGTVDNIAFLPSKEEGGWWIAQHRYTDGAAVPSLMHIAGDTLNYFSTGEFASATVGYNNQATLAINHDQSLIVTATNHTKFNIIVSEVTWTNHIPTVAIKYTFASNLGGTCLGLGLDEAGNIYATAPNKPINIWALPKDANSCVTPAAKTSLIVIQAAPTAIDNIYVMDVQKVIRNGQVLIIKDGKTYNMMGQIVE